MAQDRETGDHAAIARLAVAAAVAATLHMGAAPATAAPAAGFGPLSGPAGCLVAPCPPANVFFSASTVVASADNKALYVASPEYGTVSAFTTSLLSPSTAPPPGSAPGSSVASLFGVPLPSLANPCVGVNGLDG